MTAYTDCVALEPSAERMIRARWEAQHQRDMPAALAARYGARAEEPTGDYIPTGRVFAPYREDAPPTRFHPRSTRTVDKYRKSWFGWICATVFWSWQALFALYLYIAIGNGLLGSSIGITATLFVWVTTTTPLAILRYVTRGQRISITTQR